MHDFLCMLHLAQRKAKLFRAIVPVVNITIHLSIGTFSERSDKVHKKNHDSQDEDDIVSEFCVSARAIHITVIFAGVASYRLSFPCCRSDNNS
jgi:hypothetical protein